MNNKIIFIALALGIISCSDQIEKNKVVSERLPFYNEASFTPHWFSETEELSEEIHTIPAFNFTNQDGEIISDNTIDGKIYVVDFFFTSCPGICAKMTTNMTAVQEEFMSNEDVLILSHSVTPLKDSTPILKNYAVANGVVSGKWHLLTGDKKQLYDLGRKSYFIEEDLGLERTEDEFLHTENFVLVDQNRHIRGIYNGLNKSSVAQLIADIHTLQEAD